MRRGPYPWKVRLHDRQTLKPVAVLSTHRWAWAARYRASQARRWYRLLVVSVQGPTVEEAQAAEARRRGARR